MKRNMGYVDRAIRILVALLIGFLYFSNIITGVWAIVLLLIGAVFLVTSFVGFCPLYALLNINSCSVKRSSH